MRKKTKPSINSHEANLNGGSSPISPTKTEFAVSTAVPAGVPAAPAPAQTSSFAKSLSDILTPDMTDIEKLQKLKEWILADQHPYFTSAPKVAHLLSLRVSASGPNAKSNASGSSGEQEQALSTIPLAERLSSPKTAHLAGASHQGTHREEDPGNRKREEAQDDVNMSDADLKEKHRNMDMDMSDSPYRETTGPLLTPTHAEPYHSFAYTRPEDLDRKHERYNDRQSPRNEGRSYGRYEPTGRYRGGGYNNQGNRRFSAGDREQTGQRFHDYGRDRDYDRRSEYSAGYQRNNARSVGGNPPKQSRQNYDELPEDPAKGRVPADQIDQSMVTEASANSDEYPKPSAAEHPEDTVGASELSVSPPLANVKTEPSSASPTSIGNGPPQSTTESIAAHPLATSPRPERPLDTPPNRPGQDEGPVANHSPGSVGVRNIKPGRAVSGDRDSRPNFNGRDANRYHHQDARPRTESYHKYPPTYRPYERPPPPREDTRSFSSARGPSYRPAYAAPPPVDDRRFVPRDMGYPDDPGYRRDYRAGDWDNKRRDIDRPLDRPYDRDRDRDARDPLISPNDTRGPRAPNPGPIPPRGYPPDRDGPRGLNPRVVHEPYPPQPPIDSRGYDHDPYGMRPFPPATPYLREAPRVRPRSLSPPPRRDFRPEARPPTKRPRGPDDPYGVPPPLPGKRSRVAAS